jgi:outer membrane protein with beta-barrel domain
MSLRSVFAVGAALLVLSTAPQLRAQEDRQDGPAVVVYGAAGGFNSLAHLDTADTTNFKTGFNVGGGVGYQINKYVALRGNFTFARAESQSDLGTVSSIAGTKFNRFLYDGDLQFRYPLRGGVAPYVFVGGGAVTVKHDVTPDEPTFTKGAGKFGLGVSYQFPRSNVGVYAEGTTWVYKWDRYGFNRTQFDTTWSGGFSYRFRI